jgi:hypothetical protein
MTINQGYGTSEPSEYYDVREEIEVHESSPWPSQPLPVISATQEEAPQYGSTMTYTIPQSGVGTPLQILTRRLRRSKAYVEVNFIVPGTVVFSSKIDALSGLNGYTVAVPIAGLYRLPDWETQQPLYCIATVANLTVSVIDMSFAER